MAEDIPKRVILVLLVLTIMISVLGTWTVLDAVSGAQKYMPSSDDDAGHVSLSILPPGTNTEPIPLVDEDTGSASLAIVK